MKKTVWLTVAATLSISIMAFGAVMLSTASRAEAATQNATIMQQTEPGTITVLGYGDAVAPADMASVRLSTGGSPSFYGPDGPAFKPVDEADLALIVKVLEESAIPTETISANAFGRSDFGPASTTGEVRFVYDAPTQLSSFLTDLLDVLKEERGPKVQAATAVFMVEECATLESAAMQAALEDARARAEVMAKEMAVTLGQLVEVKEGSGDSAAYGSSGVGGCTAIEVAMHQAGFSGARLGRNSADAVEVSIIVRATFSVE